MNKPDKLTTWNVWEPYDAVPQHGMVASSRNDINSFLNVLQRNEAAL